MKLSQLVGRRLKESPKDAQLISHQYLVRGGYIRQVSAGIYSLLPVGKRIVAKIEAIIREEMNRIEGQEVTMPVILPAELWAESGRLQDVGPELLRFKDRNQKDMLLGMTHEEAVVHLTRSEVDSYRQLPVMLYQLQTKYRDEARPRGGLIRVREFTMKDAYSFHADDACLKRYYERAHNAYVRIFRRLGFKQVISILSDPGMMGGSISHEFMALADCGEDTIFMSPNGEYMANKDIARADYACPDEAMLPLEKVHTPGKKSILEVAEFLGVTPDRTGKAVFYSDGAGNLIFAVIRGDLEVNEVKLKNHLRVKELRAATDAEILAVGSVPGYASPMNITHPKIRIIFDLTAKQTPNLVVGANEVDYHYRNFNYDREMAGAAAAMEIIDIATVREGDTCPVTGEPLLMKRGIEVGNIFQLGTKYSQAMNCAYLDQHGHSQVMVMGCYGIGVGRAMAAVIEQSHDKYGPIWPFAIAPYQVHICALDLNKPGVRETAESLYRDLLDAGIETIYDDRGEKAGYMFNDADLLGVPYRLIISPKNIAQQQIEFKTRDGSETKMIALADIRAYMVELVRSEQAKGQ